MRYSIIFLLLLINTYGLLGQNIREPEEGTVSYITTQNIYVRFNSTAGMSSGDTLFMLKDKQLVPVLLVKELSSISCVCIPLNSVKLSVNDKLVQKLKIKTPAVNSDIKPPIETKQPQHVVKKDSLPVEKIQPKKTPQRISGRISVASFTNNSNTEAANVQRMRYTLSLNAANIGDSKLSAESYISFVNRSKEWDSIKANIFYGLKIYSLALQYDPGQHSKIWFGRKINPRISNVGPVDGLQVEFKVNSLTAGILTGFRPDLRDYSFNGKLLQYGGYIGHDFMWKKSNFQSTIAFIEQKNNGLTDRRFAYLQHASSITTKLSFFGSAEFDLYKKVNEVTTNSPRLSNLYLSVNYRIIRQLSLSFSYSARENIIYYETYKDIIERLLESETQRGYSLQLRYLPYKKLSIGLSGAYRDRKDGSITSFYKPSRNVYGYLTYSELPWLKASATLSATLLESSYLTGKIYSLGLSRDLLKGRLSTGLSYRYVDYKFIEDVKHTQQHMGEANLNWRIIKKFNLSVNYEGTFETKNHFNQFYINLSKSF